jgi:hypothetical protein
MRSASIQLRCENFYENRQGNLMTITKSAIACVLVLAAGSTAAFANSASAPPQVDRQYCSFEDRSGRAMVGDLTDTWTRLHGRLNEVEARIQNNPSLIDTRGLPLMELLDDMWDDFLSFERQVNSIWNEDFEYFELQLRTRVENCQEVDNRLGQLARSTVSRSRPEIQQIRGQLPRDLERVQRLRASLDRNR